MSIICATYVPEGIAMAADSRLTATNAKLGEFTFSDNALKLFLLKKHRVGIASCGDASINGKSIGDIIRIFEIEKILPDDTVITIADKLAEYASNMNAEFRVCGYENDIPYVYSVCRGTKNRHNYNVNNNEVTYGATWGGHIDAIRRLLLSVPQTSIAFQLLPLKDAVDFSEFIVDITIKYERFAANIQTCGGDIDILVITKDDAFWYRHKIFR